MSGPREKALWHKAFRRARLFANSCCKSTALERGSRQLKKPYFTGLFDLARAATLEGRGLV